MPRFELVFAVHVLWGLIACALAYCVAGLPPGAVAGYLLGNLAMYLFALTSDHARRAKQRPR